MNQLQEQKLTRCIAFREYLSQHPLTLEEYPQLKYDYEIFLDQLNLILKTLELMEENLKPSDNYDKVKEVLIGVVLSVSRKVTAYALLEELTDVQGLFCYTQEELSQGSDEKLLKKSQGILLFISNYKVELSEYDIDALLENKLRNAIDQFQVCIENKKLNSNLAPQSSEHFSHLINAADEILENKLLLLSEKVLSRNH